MRELYPHVNSSDIAAMLGTTLEKVYTKAHKMGLRKTKEYLATTAAGQLTRNDSRGRPYQFQPGHKPWNFDMKGMPPLSPKTTFRKGSRQGAALRNWVPLGSLRLSSDGYLLRKVADVRNAPQHKNWRAEHRVVWERAHGPVPAGHAVVFKPGRHTTRAEDITLDALEMVSRAELMHRNSVQRYPDDLRRLVQLRGALSRVINHRAKKGTE
jgi:hypothetical protein